MRSSLFLLMLGFILYVFQGEASAAQPLSSSEEAVKVIIEKNEKK